MRKIAVIGSLNVDYVAYVKEVPQMGETVLSQRLEIVPGGKGANQAFALGRMGADVAMFGAVGTDANASLELENLQKANVDISHIIRLDEPTGVAMISVNDSGDNCIIVAQGANKKVDIRYIDGMMTSLEAFDIIVFQLEIPLETVEYAAAKLKNMGKTIILDPAPAVELPAALLTHVDYIKPNESELATLTGVTDIKRNLETACDKLLSQGVRCVLASIGPKGVMVKKIGEQATVYGVRDVKVVDTTAAGDSFTAAFAYALANERSVEEAVKFANEIATFVVQRKGAQSSIPSREEASIIWKSVMI